MCRPAFLFLLLLLAFAIPGVSQDEDPEYKDFPECEARFAADPDDQYSSRCFFEVGRKLNQRPEAITRVKRHLARHPGHPWLTLALGHLDPDRAEALYRSAARTFAARKIALGEVLARTNLQRIFFDQGRLDEAGEQVEIAEKVARASG